MQAHEQAALRDDVQGLLAAWKPHLAAATRIVVQAPASSAGQLAVTQLLRACMPGLAAARQAATASESCAGPLYSGDHAPLERKDPRITGVPFVTRRPTFAETKRVLAQLLAVFDVTLPEPAPAPAPARCALQLPPSALDLMTCCSLPQAVHQHHCILMLNC